MSDHAPTSPDRYVHIAQLRDDAELRPEIVTRWLEEFGVSPSQAMPDLPLTELQRLVVNSEVAREPRGRNLVIAGPTSAGKTFAAEVLMARLISRAERPYGCIYAVPLRALASEKFDRFRRIFGEEGVYVSSGDYADQDALIMQRRFRVAVVVYEKLYGWLLQTNTRNAILRNLGLVVVDELQMIGDTQRGPRLELMLTMLRRLQAVHPQGLRLVGMGPHDAALRGIADWLGAVLLTPENAQRPVPLAQGYIARDGQAHFVELDPRFEGSPPSVPHAQGANRDALLKDLIRLLMVGDDRGVGAARRVLVYSPTKDRAERTAESLAAELGIRQVVDRATTQRLEDLERTHARAKLETTLRARVAFHHGDLTFGERKLVEELFKNENAATCVDVVVCTPTLAMGVNLPADYMIFTSSESYKPKTWDERGNIATPMTPLEYRNFAGRAGRYRPNAPPGHHGVALFITDGPREEAEAEIVAPIIRGRVLEVQSELLNWPYGIEPLVLAAAQSEAEARVFVVDAKQVVQNVFATTYAGVSGAKVSSEATSPEPAAPPTLSGLIGSTLQSLADKHAELLDQEFRVQRPGNVVARAGIHMNTYRALRKIAQRVKDGILDTPLVILEELAVVPEILRLYPTTLSDDAFRQGAIARGLRTFFSDCRNAGQVLGPRAQRLVEEKFVPDRFAIETMMRVAAAWLWIEGNTAEEIGRQAMLPGIRYGACNLLGDQLHWLVSTLPELWVALGEAPDNDDASLKDLRWAMGRLERRLRFGVPDYLVGVAQLRVPGLHRENVVELWREVAALRKSDLGWEHPVELLTIRSKTLENKRHRELLREVQKAVRNHAWHDDPRNPLARLVDLASAAAEGEGSRYVDTRWPALLEVLFGSADPTDVGRAFASSLTARPLCLTVREFTDMGRTRTVVEIDSRLVLVAACGDGHEGQWESIRTLWGTPGYQGRPVNGVLVLALGNVDGIADRLAEYRQPIRVVTREALGYLINQCLTSPEDATDGSTQLLSVPAQIRACLTAASPHILATAKDAENALRGKELDDSLREARMLRGRTGRRAAPELVVHDVATLLARAALLVPIDSRLSALDAFDPEDPVSAVAAALRQAQRARSSVDSEPLCAVAEVRVLLELLINMMLEDAGERAGRDLDHNLKQVGARKLMDVSWVASVDTVRVRSNPAHHAGTTYSFEEACEILTPALRLLEEYLKVRPNVQTARVRPGAP